MHAPGRGEASRALHAAAQLCAQADAPRSVVVLCWHRAGAPLSFVVGRHNRPFAALKEYHLAMGITTGTVIAGKVVVEGMELPEGSTVTVLTPESDNEVRLTAEEEAELLEAIAEADRGETISPEELFARLDRIAKL